MLSVEISSDAAAALSDWEVMLPIRTASSASAAKAAAPTIPISIPGFGMDTGHDMAEAEIGDLTPEDGVSGEEKQRREEVRIPFWRANVADFCDRQQWTGS